MGLEITVLHLYELSDDQVIPVEKPHPLNSAEKLFGMIIFGKRIQVHGGSEF
jgi:hypothetical protein